LQPIIDAIVACRREGPSVERRNVAVTLPATKGQLLVVSVRTAEPPAEHRPQSTLRGLDARQLQCVVATIENQIAEPISVSVLSSVVGLSRSHFSHAFRIAVGETPHAHVVRMRIERAMKLMLETDAPLSDIALAAGFSDQAHLCHVFRRSAGVTPARWRKARLTRAVA
jgi:AraC-like DNA-binding protein